MSENDGLRRYLEAGMALSQITRARAEELVHELIKTGEVERQRAQDWIEDLMKVSRERSEAFVATVRGEVRQQLKETGFTNVEDLAHKVADIRSRSSAAARKATGRTVKKARRAGAGKVAAKKAPAKKAAAKKAPAKKAAAKRSTAKKASAKKASAKKAGTRKAAKRTRA
jgi:polyhydroxyalkanoate synthesis regulator phasin